MDLKNLTKPLDITEIDFRVQSVNGGWYATILAYKDARVDMNRLDEVVWPLNWKREHTRDNKNCIVSIWDNEKNHWVSKEDTGTESNTEAEKWLASDSFKRACFNWGIGRELYDYPVIQVKLKDKEWDKATKKTTWDFKLKSWTWESWYQEWILIKLVATDETWEKRFSFSRWVPTWDKDKYTKKDFEELATSFNEWWLELARQHIKEQQEKFEVPADKIKKMWEIFKANQAITQDDINSLWKDAEWFTKEIKWF